ncbi:hypothetical protein AAG906_041037 [Vitis piasezkii]
MTTDPLPTHDTRVVPPPPGAVHLIKFSRYEIFMMGLHLLSGLLLAQMLERMTRYCASCTPHKLTYPFGASWPRPTHIEMP